jgi:acetylornithine deacetylase/succinyl-diaminopimelate desuccinylase-like protein
MSRYWRFGIPCVGNGPTGDFGTIHEPDANAYVDEMLLSASLMAQAAMEFCRGTPRDPPLDETR